MIIRRRNNFSRSETSSQLAIYMMNMHENNQSPKRNLHLQLKDNFAAR